MRERKSAAERDKTEKKKRKNSSVLSAIFAKLSTAIKLRDLSKGDSVVPANCERKFAVSRDESIE